MQFQGEGGRGITGNLDVAWSDRARPGWYTAQNTNGAPLEHAILLCNQLRKDAWITIPLLASDDYVTKVAQLFRYGGDGKLPYTGPPGSPRDPTLNPRPSPARPEFPRWRRGSPYTSSTTTRTGTPPSRPRTTTTRSHTTTSAHASGSQ